MSWIVVLESEGRQTESLRESLTEDGWLIEAVSSYEAAVAAVTQRMPQMVLAGVEIARAAEFLTANARANGGPGSIAIVAPGTAGAAAASAADERIERPFSDNDLRLLVRHMATAGRTAKMPPPAEDSERLTSQELFGDMLAEVERASLAPAPRAPRPAPQATSSSSLDRTLSNLLQSDRPKAAPARRPDTGVDDLLSQTLSGLDVGSGKRPAAKPATPAAPQPQAKPVAPPRQERSVDSLMADVTPAPSTPTKRSSQQLDLSALDALARSPSREREKTPAPAESLATQKIAIPTASSGAGAPAVFGQYTLLERIALGGMAEVWKARMKGVEGFQKTVAIKKILPHLTDSSDFVTMFIDEAKLAAQLNHTNIIHIYDLGKIDEDYYIAMEFVDGKDLRSILNAARDQSQPIPLDLALLVTSRLASALEHAHRKKDFEGKPLGLVHRDVSPQNVLISYDGDIKLCDFGIVKAVSKASKTQMGALKGKLQYMSPEQAWGRPVDSRSDIFSLGSLLFEMLTGRRLFTGESEMSVLDAVREGRVQAPRDLNLRVPLEVNALTLRALAREPKGRFQSAGEVQREVDSILVSLKPAPSQRDLAQYMQKLFGADSRPQPEPTSAPAAPAASKSTSKKKAKRARAAAIEPQVAPAIAAPAPAAQPASSQPDSALESATSGSRKMLWLGIAAVVLIGIVGITMRSTGSAPATPAPTPAATEPSTAPATPEVLAPAAESPDAATKVVEPATAETTAEPVKALETAQPEPAKPAETKPAEAKPAETAATKDAPAKAAPIAAVVAPPTRVDESPKNSVTPPAAEPKAEPAEAAAVVQPEVARPAPAPTPTRATPSTAPAPAPRAPSVREGDLVEAGAGVTSPVLVSVNKPEYPPMARRMKVEGTVVLALLVDETGRVIDVRIEQSVSLNVGINEAAVAAARTAKYRPATKEGVRVKVWHQLTIPFKL